MTFVVWFAENDTFNVTFDDCKQFDVEFIERDAFDVEFAEGEQFNAAFGELFIVDSMREHYHGSYEITPKLSAQVMPTAEKIMDNDVLIKSVPVYKTKNAAGGYTVYIASEVNE